uniref:AlNc14C12G1417 protein n=1 Tax=Albugo laibachii Nc14 TaxID=890382 RepID=F0W339_9STRA|nr:AlNc14C12G1417 [Albugo laibachii Nc14]|eukprot:CCA15479.1 AlNc14C12G1417 [Albugo laibachii Nc14]
MWLLVNINIFHHFLHHFDTPSDDSINKEASSQCKRLVSSSFLRNDSVSCCEQSALNSSNISGS